MKMRGASAFLRGLGLRNIRVAIYAWFFNFLFSLFIYWGYYKLFAAAAGRSVAAANIQDEMGLFTFFNDIARNHDGNFHILYSLAILAAVLYFGISIFLAGGIYATLVGNERTTFSNLLASSIENFSGMLKVFLLNLVNWGAALLICGLPFILWGGLTDSETFLQFFFYVWAAIALLILIISVAIYDYARIFKIKDDKNVFNAFKKGILFTFSNKLNLALIFLLYAVFLAVLYLSYVLFDNLAESILFPSLLFIAYQCFVLLRYFLKIVVMRAEVTLSR
ncbi:MAG: hypothetical protein GY940_34130 [bacterium]|nr:hypothetical protein [bacterium]